MTAQVGSMTPTWETPIEFLVLGFSLAQIWLFISLWRANYQMKVSLSLTHTLGGSCAGSRNWISIIHVRNLDWVPNSRLQPSPDLGIICIQTEPMDKVSLHTCTPYLPTALCDSDKQNRTLENYIPSFYLHVSIHLCIYTHTKNHIL